MQRRVYNMPMLWEAPVAKKNNIFYAPVKTTKNKSIKVVISKEIEQKCCKGIEKAVLTLNNDITKALLKELYNE